MFFACGVDQYGQLGEKANCEHSISPLKNICCFTSPIKSYSIYGVFAIIVTEQNQLQAIGYNNYCGITDSLPKEVLDHFTPFEIKDNQDRALVPKSEVCGESYSLYLLTNPDDPTKSILALSVSHTTSPNPEILNIGTLNPIALYGGNENAAAIDDQGHIIFIPTQSSKSTLLKSCSLPANEKAIHVAICLKFVFALSSTGKVYSSSIPSNNELNFSKVKELDGIEIVDISASFDHCLAVSKNGKTFGFGSNEYGQLGLGRLKKEVKKFTEISSLKKFSVCKVFAGSNHSLFQIPGGQYLSCGSNSYGHLAIKDKPSRKNYYSPVETVVEKGTFFAFAGQFVSVFFTGESGIPKDSPNMTLNDS